MDDISKVDVRRAAQALALCPDLDKQITINEACGIDCTELKALCQWATGILTKFVEIHNPILSGRSS